MKSFQQRFARWLHGVIVRTITPIAEDIGAMRSIVPVNPLYAHSARFFSQNDEDGLLLEIIRRLRLERGTFLELGVGNGLENNTLVLLAAGWNGAWLGGPGLAFTPTGRLSFVQDWITRENIVDLSTRALAGVGRTAADVSVASIDLDGNDFHFLKALLDGGLAPRILIVEYNAKFPPGIPFVMDYAADHRWISGSDYYGASLTSWDELLSPRGYRLVACNQTGVNAFFARDAGDSFADIPTELASLFAIGTHRPFRRSGWAPSPRTVEQFIRE